MDRRNFLRASGIGTLAGMMPGSILATSLAPLYTGEIKPGDAFTLLRIARIFPEYHFPYVQGYDTEQYNLKYRLCNFYADFVKDAGTFEMEKTGGPSPLFLVSSRRDAAADVITELNDVYSPDFSGKYVFEGKISTRNDLLATPLNWSCQTKIIRGNSEEAYMNTLHQWEGVHKDKAIYYYSGSYSLKKNRVEGNLSWKWGIIHLVQKMAEESLSEIHFSALDEMDMVYEHQYARFRKKQRIECGRGEVEFSLFDVLGDGIIPTVYWVDEYHRVTFIITGVEAYLIV